MIGQMILGNLFRLDLVAATGPLYFAQTLSALGPKQRAREWKKIPGVDAVHNAYTFRVACALWDRLYLSHTFVAHERLL